MTEIDIVPATAESARHLTDRIKVAIEGTWLLIVEAYQTRAWAVLGYGSWDEYCTREFGTSRLRIPSEERPEVVASLRHSGLSLRAIASATGTSKDTVSRELAGVSNETPDNHRVSSGNGQLGIDGRVYPPHSPPSSEQREKLDRLRQMADEAERANPYVPIRELTDIRDAMRRGIPKLRALKDAGQSVGADALTAGIASLCKELEELL